MFEYETISPVIPGNHIDGWKKIRRSQWSQVKSVLQEIIPNRKAKALTNIKNNYYLADTPLVPPAVDEQGSWAPTMEPDFWRETMLISLFLHPDQSQQRWEQRFAEIMAPRLSERRPVETFSLPDSFADRPKFLEVAHYLNKNSDPDFGVFGGLEQRLLPYYVQSPVYTDETFIANNTEYRRIPWESPKWAFVYILSENGKFTQSKYVSPFTPYQWLHELFISTFQYDIDYEERSDIACMEYYLPALRDNADDMFHRNHLKAARLMIEIFEDEGTPKYLRDLWRQVKNSAVDSIASDGDTPPAVASGANNETENNDIENGGIETNGVIVLAGFADNQARQRARDYLDDNSRPASDEQLTPDEVDLFRAVEETEPPLIMQSLDADQLAWVVDAEPDSIADPIALGASHGLMVTAHLEDEPCFTIQQWSEDGITMVFHTLFYDDETRDKPIEAFNQLLLDKLNDSGEVDMIIWLDNYLKKAGKVPQWDFEE